MSKIAIIIGTYNRGDLLKRSLQVYDKKMGLDIVVIDDGSTDDTMNICEQARSKIHYINLGEKTGWRDSASFLNAGIRFALYELQSDFIFITHPEIIVGKTTIENAVAAATDQETWVSCKGYYLTPEQQERIDEVSWKWDLMNVKQLPNFYSAKSAEHTGNTDYLPSSIEKTDVWQSWIFGGGSAAMWKYFGGLTEFETWGSVDVDLCNRRMIAGMRTVTPNEQTDFVVHQNHDERAARDMSACMAALPIYESKSQALKPELLYQLHESDNE